MLQLRVKPWAITLPGFQPSNVAFGIKPVGDTRRQVFQGLETAGDTRCQAFCGLENVKNVCAYSFQVARFDAAAWMCLFLTNW
jgi:hypothetical protein